MTLRPNLSLSRVDAQRIVDRAGIAATVVSVEVLHGGEISAVWSLACGEAMPPLVLKVYPDSLHWKMQKEAYVMSLLGNRLATPLPHLKGTDSSKAIIALNYTLMSKLPGETLGNLWPQLTQPQRDAALRLIGALLREFHAIPQPEFGYIGAERIVNGQATNRAYIISQFQKKARELVERGGSEQLAARVLARADAGATLFEACPQAVLCHNDLHAGNVLGRVDDGVVTLTGVVDFEGALAGDPLMDVAKACFYLREDERRSLLAGYGPIDRPQWQQTLRLYHLLFVLELWCWMAQIGKPERLAALTTDLETFSAAES